MDYGIMTRQQYIVGSSTGMKALAVSSQKATLTQVDKFMDWLIDDSGKSGKDALGLYKSVAWTFWCVNLRADAVASVPYKIYTAESNEDTEENEVEGFDVDLTEPLWLTEAWLNLKGVGYWLKRYNQVMLKDLQVLNATTMSYPTEAMRPEGPAWFIQKKGVLEQKHLAKDIVYFHTFASNRDLGPGTAPGEVGRRAGQLIANANDWAVQFFLNGAIPAVLLTTDQTMTPESQQRIKKVWQKALKGVGNAFQTFVMGGGLRAEVIQPAFGELAMPKLEQAKKQQILAAHKMPPGYATERTNLADRDALQLQFLTRCIIPEIAIWIAPTINKQLLNPLGMRIGFQYSELEELQAAELKKAESSSFYVAGVASVAFNDGVISIPEYRATVNDVLVMGNMTPLEDVFVPPPPPPEREEEQTQGAMAEPQIAKGFADDLDKWRRMAVKRVKEGRPSKALEFASDTIPAGLHSLIRYGLDRAVTLGDVTEVFDAVAKGYKAVRLIPDGADEPIAAPMTVEVDEGDVDRAILLWDAKLPEFAGLLDADVVKRERYDGNAGQ